MKDHNYFVYITTNLNRSVLYIGVTNNLEQRVIEHYLNRGNQNSFAGRYNCWNLIYSEKFDDINDAIEREKELKGWRREKKNALINEENPKWKFLNESCLISGLRRKWQAEENYRLQRDSSFVGMTIFLML